MAPFHLLTMGPDSDDRRHSEALSLQGEALENQLEMSREIMEELQRLGYEKFELETVQQGVNSGVVVMAPLVHAYFLTMNGDTVTASIEHAVSAGRTLIHIKFELEPRFGNKVNLFQNGSLAFLDEFPYMDDHLKTALESALPAANDRLKKCIFTLSVLVEKNQTAPLVSQALIDTGRTLPMHLLVSSTDFATDASNSKVELMNRLIQKIAEVVQEHRTSEVGRISRTVQRKRSLI